MHTLKNEKIWANLALLLALFFIALRFVSLENAPYIMDEPIFQSWAMELLAGGKFPWVAMGGSSLPVSYGAEMDLHHSAPCFHLSRLPLFFSTPSYTPRHFFSSTSPSGGLFPPAVAAWTLLLASTSPFLFFFPAMPGTPHFSCPLPPSCSSPMPLLRRARALAAIPGTIRASGPLS